MKVTVINGPNINLIGIREPEKYGNRFYSELTTYILDNAKSLGMTCEVWQSNHEGEIIDKIQHCLYKSDGIIINPAGYTHTSVAIADAIAAVNVPTVEVHLTDTDKREDFRKISYVAPVCVKTIKGKGFEGYKEALEFLAEYVDKAKSK